MLRKMLCLILWVLLLLTVSVLLFLFLNGLFFSPIVIVIHPGFFDLHMHFKGPGFFMAVGTEFAGKVRSE